MNQITISWTPSKISHNLEIKYELYIKKQIDHSWTKLYQGTDQSHTLDLPNFDDGIYSVKLVSKDNKDLRVIDGLKGIKLSYDKEVDNTNTNTAPSQNSTNTNNNDDEEGIDDIFNDLPFPILSVLIAFVPILVYRVKN